MQQINPKRIKNLLANGNTTEALASLSIKAEGEAPEWEQAVAMLQASHQKLEEETLTGVLSNEEADRRRNRINAGILQLATYLESGKTPAKAALQTLKREFFDAPIAAKMEENSSRILDSNIHIEGSSEVIIGSGNRFTKKVFNALGRKQFWAISIGLILLLVLGSLVGNLLLGGQEEAYASLGDIKKELSILSDLNAEARKNLEKERSEIDSWLAKGMSALKKGDYEAAIPYLEKVSGKASLASVHQNLAYAYEQIGNTDKAKKNLDKAREINPNLKTEKSYASLKGKRINLILPDHGAEVLETSNQRTYSLIDGKEGKVSLYNADQITFGFKDEKTASFDRFTVLITEASKFNTNEFELFIGNEAPNGKFDSIGKFTTYNGYLAKTPYQEFEFSKVKAKYFRFKILSSHGGSTYYPHLREIQLWGTLN